jgi:hypothetical protein
MVQTVAFLRIRTEVPGLRASDRPIGNGGPYVH